MAADRDTFADSRHATLRPKSIGKRPRRPNRILRYTDCYLSILLAKKYIMILQDKGRFTVIAHYRPRSTIIIAFSRNLSRASNPSCCILLFSARNDTKRANITDHQVITRSYVVQSVREPIWSYCMTPSITSDQRSERQQKYRKFQ